MLRPERMVKVRATCHQASLAKVIEALYAAKAIHLSEHKKDELLDIGSPLARHEAVSRTLLATRSLISLLGIEATGGRAALRGQEPAKELDLTERKVTSLKVKAESLAQRQKALEAGLALLRQERHSLAILKLFNIKPEHLKGSERLKVLAGTLKSSDGLEERLAAITLRFELHVVHPEDAPAVLIAFDAQYAAPILQLLSQAGFAELKLPESKEDEKPGEKAVGKEGRHDGSGRIGHRSGRLASRDPAASLTMIDKRIAAAEQEFAAAGTGLARLAAEQRDFLLAAQRSLSREAQKTGAPLGFGVTEATAVISGWVPEPRLAGLRSRLEEVTGKALLFEELEAEEDEAGPVKFTQGRWTSPFHALLSLYSLPSSREIDPTLFLFLTFPIFFGFMLGDIGYGLLTLALFLYLRKKLPDTKDLVGVSMRELLGVMAWASLWSVAFGFVFGEFFGLERLGSFALPHLLSRSENVAALITISLLIGIGHLLVGLVLGFLNVNHHHGLGHAVKEKLGWMLLLPGIAKLLVILGLLAGGAGSVIDAALPGLVVSVLAAAGVVLIIMGEGVRGAIELPGILSNILSYARLMALGIASVSLAIVINQFTQQFAAQGGLMLVAAILIFALGHTVNIVLGVIGPFLHSLRLHYVEMFGKFFEGGGEEFRPFGAEPEE